MDHDYQPPVDQLLTLGIDDRLKWNWPDYLEMGFTEKDIPGLIRMATDEQLNNADGDSPEVWAPLHAWRTLGQLKAEEAVEPLLSLLDLDDDWSREEIPEVMAMIGPAAIPYLDKYIENNTHKEFARISAAHALEKIGNLYPGQKQTCINILIRHLQNYSNNLPTLNAFLISHLIALEAVEAAPVMEEAYAAGQVDISVLGDWENAQRKLGLLDEQNTSAPSYQMDSLFPGLREKVTKKRQQNKSALQKEKSKRKMAKASRKKSRKKGKK